LSNPTKPTQIGKNRTGISTSPIDSAAMISGAERPEAEIPGTASSLMNARIAWSREAAPVGTMAPPASLKGIAKTVMEKLKGNEPLVYLDKLGERLAFERSGTRLYEGLLAKFEASSTQHDPTINTQAILEIHDDELTHVAVLQQAIVDLGGDPTVMTPCADVTAVASMGLFQAMSAPQTTFTQALGIALIAELTDNAGWELLIDLATGLGQDEHVRQFRLAMVDEQRHLEMISRWHAVAVVGQAGVMDEVVEAAIEPPV